MTFKKACEYIAHKFNAKILIPQKSEAITIIRFGNVLGSSGSLLEVIDYKFRNNLTLNITDMKAKRYFMTK